MGIFVPTARTLKRSGLGDGIFIVIPPVKSMTLVWMSPDVQLAEIVY